MPASLLANWKAELDKFAATLSYLIAHPSENSTGKRPIEARDTDGLDLLITTYGVLSRTEWLRERNWDLVILDEAQAIKNSGTRQSRTVKELKAVARVTMTGTPVENRLSDLWSLFDFLNPGLLGGAKTFATLVKQMEASSSGMKRRGIVLAQLMKLKQICNHADQLAGAGDYAPDKSGKFLRLRALCEELGERRKKCLFLPNFVRSPGRWPSFSRASSAPGSCSSRRNGSRPATTPCRELSARRRPPVLRLIAQGWWFISRFSRAGSRRGSAGPSFIRSRSQSHHCPTRIGNASKVSVPASKKMQAKAVGDSKKTKGVVAAKRKTPKTAAVNVDPAPARAPRNSHARESSKRCRDRRPLL